MVLVGETAVERAIEPVARLALDVVIETIERRLVRRPVVRAVGLLSDLLESTRRHFRPSAHLPPHRLVVPPARCDDRAIAGVSRPVASDAVAAHRRHLYGGGPRHRQQLAHLRVGGQHRPDRADQPRLFHQPAAQRCLRHARLSRAASTAAVGVGGDCSRRRRVSDGRARCASLDRAVAGGVVRYLRVDEKAGAAGSRAGARRSKPASCSFLRRPT